MKHEFFTIQTINVRTYDTSFGGYPYVCDVVVKIDSKYWSKLKKNDDLGQLYGGDISNEVYRMTSKLVPAWNPTVSDRDLAKAGIKTVVLKYYFKDHVAAEKLGLEVLRLKNGECLPPFGGVAFVYDSRKTNLKLA